MGALVLALGACQHQGANEPGPKVSSISEAIPPAPYHPPVELVSTTAEDLVRLRTPVSNAAVVQLIEEYFTAITQESNDRLSRLLADGAFIRYAGEPRSRAALMAWVQRFAQLDYKGLDPTLLYRRSEVELYSSSDAERLRVERSFHLDPRDGEWLVRFAVHGRDVGQKARFGSGVEMVVQSTPDGLRVRAIHEDFKSP